MHRITQGIIKRLYRKVPFLKRGISVILFFAELLAWISVYSIPALAANGGTTAVNENDFFNLSKNDHKELHTFFSNFSEVGMDRFDRNNYTIDEVVDFALWHDWLNNFDRFSIQEDYYAKISSDYVEKNIERYFGIKNIDHTIYPSRGSSSNEFNRFYENGFYFIPCADGEAIMWSQVTNFYDNGDGTYTAYYDVYEALDPPENLYEDNIDWRWEYGEPDYDYIYSCVAIVQPYEYSGKQTYQLLYLENIESSVDYDQPSFVQPDESIIQISGLDRLTLTGNTKIEDYEINSENKGTVLIMDLDSAFSALLYDDFMGYDGEYFEIDSVQLNLDPVEAYTDKLMTVTGDVMIAHTGHHLREIVLNNVDVLTIAELNRSTNLEVSDGVLIHNGHCYKIFDDGKDWKLAKEYCESLGGHLATITSAAENAVIHQYITAEGYHGVYFGLTDEKEEGVWEWITGEEFEYSKWSPGEPNNEFGREHYAMFSIYNDDGTWNDIPNEEWPYICEWDTLIHYKIE